MHHCEICFSDYKQTLENATMKSNFESKKRSTLYLKDPFL